MKLHEQNEYKKRDFSDSEVIARAKRYAAMTFDQALDGDQVERHHINSATKIVGYLLNVAEGEEKAPELGVVLQELKRSEARGERASVAN